MQQDPVPSLQECQALLVREFLSKEPKLGGKFAPFLYAGFGGTTVTQKLADSP